MSENIKDNGHFILLGASLDTGNMGVSALFVSTIKCIMKAYPDAKISLLEGLRTPGINEVRLGDGQVIFIDRVGVRQNKTIWRKNHLLRLLITVMIIRMIPIKKLRKRLITRNEYLNAITTANCVADITGGDSFSDIYGITRLFYGVLHKALVVLSGQMLIMLPQTYGPFKSNTSKLMARWVLKKVEVIYTRDKSSIVAIQSLMRNRRMKVEPRFSYDMAFVLDAIRPKSIHIIPGMIPENKKRILIGINVNGLLYNGGYTRDNMFDLKGDYTSLIRILVNECLTRENTVVFLIPHVFASPEHVESDTEACRKVYKDLHADYPNRLFYLEGIYDQSEIKFIIGGCDFFIGSRMHACIAAISQGIPSAPLAYSNKFYGVFESLGIGHVVSNLMETKQSEVIEHVMNIYDKRESLCNELEKNMPVIQNSIYKMIAESFPPSK